MLQKVDNFYINKRKLFLNFSEYATVRFVQSATCHCTQQLLCAMREGFTFAWIVHLYKRGNATSLNAQLTLGTVEPSVKAFSLLQRQLLGKADDRNRRKSFTSRGRESRERRREHNGIHFEYGRDFDSYPL